MPTISLAGIVVLATDSTAPVLSSPSATTTGETTAIGSVSTNEGVGTLYYLASANATETAGTVVASGAEQVVSGTGVQNVSLTGLTGATAYYLHFVHVDPSANVSNRVTSSQFTTAAGPQTTIVLSGVVVRPLAETIVSVSGCSAGETVTFTTGGLYDLTSDAPSAATYAGIALTSITVTGDDTFTAVMPSGGVAIGSTNDFTFTVLGIESPGFAAEFETALGQYVTLVIPYADFAPDAWVWDDELVGTNVEDLIVDDQIDIALKSSGTTSTPAGYDVNIDAEGNIWLSDPAGSEGNLAAEDEAISVTLALISSADGYSRSDEMDIVLALNMPSGTLTLSTPVTTSTTATLGFSWTGTDATAFEYQINSGTITEIGASPVAVTSLTAATAYTYRVRPINGSWAGAWVSGSFTTQAAIDTTPDAFAFTDQTGVALSTVCTSNVIQVTGVTAGQDVAVTITGGEYSVSTDGGTTWGAWTSAGSNVRLNYRIRLRLTSSSTYETPVIATLTVGGVSAEFSAITLENNDPPVITLVGGNISLIVGMAWTEPGYSAVDNYGDAVPVERLSSSGTVNTATPGTYTITYTAEDLAGNIGTTTRTVTVVAASSGLQVDSAPAEINRYGTFNLVISGAVEAPTLQNTAIRVNGATGPQLTMTGVTGSGPWTIAVTARFDVPIKFSTAGYPLHITVGDEMVQTEAIPMLAGVLPFVDLLTVATGPGTIHDVFPQWELSVGDQIVHLAATRIAGVPVAIDSSGTPRLLGPLLVNDSIWYRVIKADGTVSTVPPNLEFTFQADSDVEYIRDVVPRLLATDANLVRVFLDRDNTVRVAITHDGTAINMEQFSRFVLSGFPDDIDSDDNPEAFDVTEGNGVLDLMLGQLLTSPGVYKLRLVGYSQLHTNGVVLFDPSLVDASVTAIVMNA